jgi:O-antigen/teichoic acid export membrane protein
VCALSGIAIFMLRSIHATRAWNIARVGPNVIWLVLLLGATLLGEARPEFLALVFLLLNALYALLLVWFVRDWLRGHWRPDLKVASKMLRYGLPIAGASMPQLLGQRVDQLVVVSFLSVRELGFYAVAVAWASAVLLAASAISSVAFPRLSAATDEAVRVILVRKIIAKTAGVAIGAAVVLALLGYRMIPIVFGESFAPAIPIALLLLFATPLRAINDSMTAALKGCGATAAVMASEVVGVCVAILLLAILVPRMGLFGAGLSAVAGALTSCTTSALMLVRHAHDPIVSVVADDENVTTQW